MAVLATERFFNDLRAELGDDNFDQLFAIHPSLEDLQKAPQGVAQMRKFKFFTSSLSSGIYMSKRLVNNIREQAKKHFSKFKSLFSRNSKELTIEDVSFRRRRRRSLNF